MAGPLPLGDPAPPDGHLPASATQRSASRPLSLYLHVPFCRVRCGYCDFNTYTAGELRGVSQADYAEHAVAEIRFARRALDESGAVARAASTVFFGGGTPTLLPVTDLARMLEAVRGEFGIAPGAEVTTEANPDSVDEASLVALARAGVTRVSFGMQSAVPHVLATLDRTHNPARLPEVVRAARDAGLEVSVDLIYGTPGESLQDWQRSLDAAIALRPDHLSAYALIIEDGTRLARHIRRGDVPAPDDDLQADMYELAELTLAEAGYNWYEVSNWAAAPEHRSRHNLAYWTDADWWGIGPGAHSHVDGVRWWNVKHPAAYAERVVAGVSPAAGRETLDSAGRALENILLRVRLAEGLPTEAVPASTRSRIAGLIADGLIDGKAALAGRIILTLRGRLLTDLVVRALTE